MFFEVENYFLGGKLELFIMSWILLNLLSYKCMGVVVVIY